MLNQIKNLTTVKKALLSFALLFTLAETGVRLSGISDFPTYTVENDIGFIPKPTQSGDFPNKNFWIFNDGSMGTETNWNPEKRS